MKSQLLRNQYLQAIHINQGYFQKDNHYLKKQHLKTDY